MEKLSTSLAVALSALLLSAACTKSQPSQQVEGNSSNIVNGRPVVATDSFAKYTVAVGPAQEPQCTGVVIAPHHILTAGHCAEAIEGGVVFFALDYAKVDAVSRQIKTITRHPSYCESCANSVSLGNTNDLSIVEIEGDLPAGFEPIAFTPKSAVVNKAQVHLAGYGANENYDYETIMKVTEVPVDKVGNSEFSTDESKSGSCNGDSGGPAFMEVDGQMTLAGITSRGDSYCRAMGVYTIPDVHNTWIQSVITK